MLDNVDATLESAIASHEAGDFLIAGEKYLESQESLYTFQPSPMLLLLFEAFKTLSKDLSNAITL